MQRLLLVRHATTAATRRAAFPVTTGREAVAGCADLDAPGAAAATALGAALPPVDRCWTSRARRAVRTALCLGLTPDAHLAELAEGDFGGWAGSTLDQVHGRDPDGLATWLTDPGLTPHGGESLASVRRRAADVLARADASDGTTVAVSHGGLIKAALLEVLGLPDAALWRVECAPASVTELHPGTGGWRVACVNWTPSPSAWQSGHGHSAGATAMTAGGSL